MLITAVAAAGCNASQERAGARGTVGYTVTPPEGWQDITRSVSEKTGAALDVAYGGPVLDGVRLNVNIARRAAGRDRSLRRLVRDGRREVDDLGGGRLRFTRAIRTEVDGEPALRYDFTTGAQRVRQVGVVHGADYYVVTLTGPASAFRDSVAPLDGLLRSWRWDA